MDPKPVLSEYFAKLPTSPDAFPFFYRKLIGLRFPIDVAEILELRYLCHQAIDQRLREEQDYEWGEFAVSRIADMERLGINKSAHRERLAQLFLMLRNQHAAHKAASAMAETELRAAIAQNRFAQNRSWAYGKAGAAAALGAGLAAVLLSPPAVLMQGIALFLGYLSLDSFYSVLVLRREERRLDTELAEVLRRRVRNVNWRAVLRQTAAILGYAPPRGGEAFRIIEQETAPHEVVQELDDA